MKDERKFATLNISRLFSACSNSFALANPVLMMEDGNPASFAALKPELNKESTLKMKLLNVELLIYRETWVQHHQPVCRGM